MTARTDDGVFMRPDGSTVSVSCVTSPILESGRVSGCVAAFSDNSWRKELERQKEEFFAMITHDLKSPLTVIMGYADLIREDGLPAEDAREMAGSIKESSVKLVRMINDILTVARCDFGGLKLEEGLEDLGLLLREIETAYRGAARSLGQELVFEAPEGLVAVADRNYIRRSVENLVQNAINYNRPGGRVTVRAYTAESDEGRAIAIECRDDGCGIPPEYSKKIFDKYYRVPGNSAKGSGLGLYIVKAVAEAHGGRVELESEPGKGSIFRILLPVRSY